MEKKNIHVIPTEKPSRLRFAFNGNIVLGLIQNSIKSKNDDYDNQHIYITSDEEIKEGDWLFDLDAKRIVKADNLRVLTSQAKGCWYYKKIILTTDDQDLIKDGVQAIDDEFLEWFVNHPECDKVKVENYVVGTGFTHIGKTPSKEESLRGCYDNGEQIIGKWEDCYKYKIIIQTEELKYPNMEKKTIEEAANEIYSNDGYDDELYCDLGEVYREKFIEGAEWYAKNQSEQMYSGDDMIQFVDFLRNYEYEAKNNLGFDERPTEHFLKAWKESKK